VSILLKGDNMKDLIIVGAGSFAREVLLLVKRINEREKKWNILGFIDDNNRALDGIKCDYSIIGSICNWTPQGNEVFACGISNPKAKEHVVNKLKSKNAVFETLVAPHARLGDFVDIGEGVVVLGDSIGSCAVLGNFVSIMGSMIGQDSVIGDYSTTTGYANIASAKLGKRVFVGSHAVVLNRLSVGDDAVIGAGSIVIRNVKAGTTVFGSPAKRIY